MSIEQALRDMRERARRQQELDRARDEHLTPIAFRASVTQRLRALEREVAEVRSRINGLLFVVAGAVVTQVVLRLFA
jgi:hypothetical protein